MIRAARAGDINEVRRLIQSGVDVNEPDMHGWTPLISAAHRLDITIELIKAGANVNSQAHSGWTPLDRASYHSQFAVVLTLLKAGAVTGTRGPTSLCYSSSYYFVDRVMLIEMMIHGNQSCLFSLPIDLIRMSVKFLL